MNDRSQKKLSGYAPADDSIYDVVRRVHRKGWDVRRMTRATKEPPAARRARICRALLSGGVVTVLAGSGCVPTEVSSPPSSVTVGTGPLASVIVVPAADALLVGDSQQLVAMPKDAKGQPLTLRDTSWASLNPEVAAVSPTGIVSGRAPGSARIVATSEGQSGAAVITVWPVRPGAAECDVPKPGWIWCDDFEKDRLSSYFHTGRPTASCAFPASAMRAQRACGPGSLVLAKCRRASSIWHSARPRGLFPAGGCWNDAVSDLLAAPREMAVGWTGGGNKLSRAQTIVNTNWAQAMMAHVWSGVLSEGQAYLERPSHHHERLRQGSGHGVQRLRPLPMAGDGMEPHSIFDQICGQVVLH